MEYEFTFGLLIRAGNMAQAWKKAEKELCEMVEHEGVEAILTNGFMEYRGGPSSTRLIDEASQAVGTSANPLTDAQVREAIQCLRNHMS